MMSPVDDALLARIERAAGVPGLATVLASLPPTDLQSLLLAVFAARARTIPPARLLQRYEADDFVELATVDPAAQAALDAQAFVLLARHGFTAVELSPVVPLGTVSVLGGLEQSRVVSTVRNTEVVSDSTNALALAAAVRRRALLRADPRSAEPVRLATSHRLLRGQRFAAPLRQHFRLLALTTAGRDQGSFRFEAASLLGQVDALVLLLGPARPGARVTVTDLTGTRGALLSAEVLEPLRQRHPDLEVAFDPERAAGRGYYVDACFHIHATPPGGTPLQLGDGGFTTWTRDLLGSAKERLLTGCLATERILQSFPPSR
jgi:hypothetical protein